jgi:hypothetical protein
MSNIIEGFQQIVQSSNLSKEAETNLTNTILKVLAHGANTSEVELFE